MSSPVVPGEAEALKAEILEWLRKVEVGTRGIGLVLLGRIDEAIQAGDRII